MDLIDKLPYFYDNGYTRPIIEAEQKERDILVEEIEDVLTKFLYELELFEQDKISIMIKQEVLDYIY